MQRVAKEVAEASNGGIEIAIVVGGGNIFRGVSQQAKGMDPANADYMGMLATVINALALRDALEHAGSRDAGSKRDHHAAAGRALHPPSCHPAPGERDGWWSSRRGRETPSSRPTPRPPAGGGGRRRCLLKASKVDGIYSADPQLDPTASKLQELTYMEFLSQELRVMDATAVTMCREHDVPIIVFDMTTPGNILRAVSGEPIGTVVH